VLHEEHPDLLHACYVFSDVRARCAIESLVGNSLIDEGAADHYLTSRPHHDLP
jgi:hypothetical protein